MTTEPVRGATVPGTNSGSFAPTIRDEQIVVLLRPRPALTNWEVDDSFPVPQANDLDKVFAVVDAVDAGADTPESIAVALGVSERQGAYYANAAGYLSLVSKGYSHTTAATYELTPFGAEVLDSVPNERAAVAAEIVDRIPNVDVLTAPGGFEEYVRDLQADGLDETTARRRADSLKSWVESVESPVSFSERVEDTHHGCASRFDTAADLARQQKAARIAVPEPKPVCPSCFTQLPAIGICGTCD